MALDSTGRCLYCGRTGVQFWQRCPCDASPAGMLHDLEKEDEKWSETVTQWDSVGSVDEVPAHWAKACSDRRHYLNGKLQAVKSSAAAVAERYLEGLVRPNGLTCAQLQKEIEQQLLELERHERKLASLRERRQLLRSPGAWLAAITRDIAGLRVVSEEQMPESDAPIEVLQLHEERLKERCSHARHTGERPEWSWLNEDDSGAVLPREFQLAMKLKRDLEAVTLVLETKVQALASELGARAELAQLLESAATALEGTWGPCDWTAVHEPRVVDLVREWQKLFPREHRDAWRSVRPSWNLAAQRWRTVRELVREGRGGDAAGEAPMPRSEPQTAETFDHLGLRQVALGALQRRSGDEALAELAEVVWIEDTAKLLVEASRGLVWSADSAVRQVYFDVSTGEALGARDRRVGQYLESEPYKDVREVARKRLLRFVQRLDAHAQEPSSSSNAGSTGAAVVEGLAPDQRDALRLITLGEPVVLVTGAAGTGKSHVLRAAAAIDRHSVVAAPTGVAALSVGGVTVHSLIGAGREYVLKGTLGAMSSEKRQVLRKLRRLVLDEVSMLRADLLDALDRRMREARSNQRPFGGVQLVMFGDLLQLPPVVTEGDWNVLDRSDYGGEHFFFAHSLGTSYRRAHPSWCIELKTQHRQAEDAEFADLLGRIRLGKQTDADLALLNGRVVSREAVSRTATVLCTRNRDATAVNEAKLSELPGPSVEFRSSGSWLGVPPADERLIVRRGARVVLLRNDPDGSYVNGSQGRIFGWSERTVRVELDNGQLVTLERARWEQREAYIDSETDEIAYRIISVFEQIPLRLSWALTIHKSQGMTLADVAVDLGAGSFAPGQTYVALSRARRLSDVVLLNPIGNRDVVVDAAVAGFREGARY